MPTATFTGIDFIEPNLCITESWQCLYDRICRQPVRAVDEVRSDVRLTVGQQTYPADGRLLTKPLISGDLGRRHVLGPEADRLNI